MKIRLFKFVSILFLIFAIIALYSKTDLGKSTAYAVGDLTINWGVPSGNPIFTIANMLPGDMQTHSVLVTNNAETSRPVGVGGIKTSETNNFANVLDFVISDGSSDLYGGTLGTKTLAQFFIDSAGPSGIPLSTLNPGQSVTYTFKVTFDSSAGNPYQGSSIVFDLKIGISFELPEDCLNIEFSASPIFGTQGNDHINGTNGNDIIIGFEGNDILNGTNGNDCVIGNQGNDRLDGSNGNDVLVGGSGNDRLDASNGNDKIFGNAGDDEIRGSNGDDQIFAGAGNDLINGSNGNDQLFGEDGNDSINGVNGQDTIVGGEGNDNMLGGADNDNLTGGPGTDFANGGPNTDTCSAETEINCEL